MTENILKKYGIANYSVEYFTVNPKHNFPSITCKARNYDGKKVMLKIFIGNDSSKIFELKKQVELLNSWFPGLLNAKIITDNVFQSDFISGATLSSLMRVPFIGRYYVFKAIDWLIIFHNNNHFNGTGHIHGDFSSYEIIKHKNKLVVLDWEDYKDKTEQLIDIIYFIFRDTFQEYFFGTKQTSFLSFIDCIVSEESMHPYLKYYIQNRQHISYSKERRKKALFYFIKNRIERENKNYSIPRKDRYFLRQIRYMLSR